ncbi:MAG: hypothetical protein IH624_17385 [Phycisphaerae bacterium]|nr:hypothetical protein [Phycisphaerae bacterium]
MKQSAIYQRFKKAVTALGHDAATVERMSTDMVRLFGEIEADAQTATYLEDMKKKLARELRSENRRAAGSWLQAQVRQRYKLATVRMPEDKIAVIYLDGLDDGF